MNAQPLNRCSVRKASSLVLLVSGLLVSLLTPVIAVPFEPPENNVAPRQASGQAARSFGFIPPADNTAPRRTSSGASREGFNFIPPPDNTAPRRTSSGASRDIVIPSVDRPSSQSSNSSAAHHGHETDPTRLYQETNEPMLALTPESSYGQTLRARPIILAYVPVTNTRTAVFSLKDEAQNLVYQASVLLPQESGIVAIQIPDSAPELAINEYYQWFLTLQTDDQITPASPFIDAWIQRVEPDAAVAEALITADSLTAAEILAKAGHWYDTSAILGKLQLKNASAEATDSWLELLTSVGLERVAKVPVAAPVTGPPAD